MDDVKIIVNEYSEMLTIEVNGAICLRGNYWYFDRPNHIIKLLNSLTHVALVFEKAEEDSEDDGE